MSAPTILSTADELQFQFYSDPMNPTPHQQAGGASRGVAGYLLVSALIGVGASAWLLHEEAIHKANPMTQLSCSINSAIDCGASMDSVYGHMLFSIPNAVWGVIGFAVMALLSIWLLAGKTLPRLVWALWTAGTGLALASVFFFLTVSVAVLGVLCPYCLLVWFVTIPLLGVVSTNYLRQRATVEKPLSGTAIVVINHSWIFTLVLYLIVVVVILARFGQTLFG